MSSLQDQFVSMCKSLEPGISQAEIARRLGVTPTAVGNRKFSVSAGVGRWNDHVGREAIRYCPPHIEVVW